MGSKRKKKTRKAIPVRTAKTRRLPGVWIGALLLVFAAAATWMVRLDRGTPGGEPLNLVLLSVDTLRADHLSCYGGAAVRTPNLDRLADDGVLFEHVQTVAPTTLPAHASLFTGLTPVHHGVRDNVGFYLPRGVPTLASILGEAGYETGGFVGAFILDSRFGIDQGFETYFDQFDTAREDIAGGFVSQRRGEVVLDRALEWMGKERQRPFFAFIHFYDPHTPYDPPQAFMPRETDNRSLYAGEVAYVDSLVGRLLDWLDQRRLTPRTLVVITSDHGEALGEHGEQTHGFFLYQAALEVPLVMRTPGSHASVRIDELVRLTDVAPTLLDLLGLPIPAGMDGRSLRPLIDDPTLRLGLPAYSETYLPRLHYGWSELRSFRVGADKLILAPRIELYRLDRDPMETRNVAEEEPETTRRLTQKLVELLKEARAVSPQPDTVDPSTLTALQSLGYAGGGASIEPGVAYTDLTDPKDRIHVYERINDPILTSVDPSDESAYEHALQTIRSVIDEDPTIPRAHVLYGELLLESNRAAESVRSFRRAVELDPRSFAATYGLGLAQLALGRIDEAAESLQQAAKIEPLNTKAHFRLAHLEMMRGDLEAAEQWLRRAIAIHPDRLLQETLAEILLKTGRGAEAEETLNRLAQQYGEDALTLYNLGQTLLADGDAATALRHLSRAARLAPGDADIRHGLANALAATGDLEAAVAEYRRAVAIEPCFAGALSNLGTTFLRLGKPDDAVTSYEAAIACNGEYITAYNNLASVWIQKGRVDRAIETLRRALEVQPDNAELKKTLETLERRGR